MNTKMLKKYFKKYFIPHEGNNYKPHSLREPTALAILVITFLLYGLFSFVYPAVLERSNFTATILPAVLVDLTNENREAYDTSLLQINPLLVEAAQLKANDMAAKSYFAHTSPKGLTPWHWFNLTGYRFSYAGENLAVNFIDSEEAIKAWMGSPGHRANILNGKFTEIGIATARGVYDGRETVFVVQLFGTPASIKAGISVTESAVLIPETNVKEIAKQDVKGATGGEEFYIETEASPLPSSTAKSLPPAEAVPQYASAVEKALAAPVRTLNYLYLGFIALVLVSLLLSIFIEIRRQHPKHVFYGITLLVVLGFFAYATQSALLSPLLIR
ncbi:MAG: CAP domain-containing protein [Candidatus Colwellbacteria bacterium]